jgi:hypothetical protein
MDPTAIQAGAPPHPPAVVDTAIQAEPPRPSPAITPAPRGKEKSWLYRVLRAVASLRVTVVLFLLSLILVFYGTLAQVDNGIWTVVKQYFRSGFVKIPMNVVLLHANRLNGLNPQTHEPVVNFPRWVPYPGGWLLGGLLLVNLLAAHAVRFQLSWKRSGILLLHAGLIVMMLGELVTGLVAIEGQMQIEEGHSSNAVSQHGAVELAFDRVAGPKEDEVTVVPGAQLRPGAVLEDERLPVTVEVKHYYVHSELFDVSKEPETVNPATAGLGLYYLAKPQAEVSGVTTDQGPDAPAAYVTFRDRQTNTVLGTYLMTVHLRPEWITLGEHQYQVCLRFKQTYRDFSLYLEKFDYKKFLGTEMAKDYRSHIRLVNKQTGEDRKIQIYMNTPLSYQGETFYQADLLRDPPKTGPVKGTVLQVVRNPGWVLPYLACFMVSFGMLIHFGINLTRFIERRAAS